MHSSAPLPFLRACAVTAATVGLAAGTHTAAGGHLPGLPILALLTFLSLAPVMFLARYRLRLPAMAGILALSQGILHYAFGVLAESSGHCAGPGIPAHGHHQVFSLPECADAAAGTVAGHQLTGWPGAAMFAAHVIATGATALLLARGEELLWHLVAWLQPLTRVLRPAVFPVQARPPLLREIVAAVPHPGLRIPALRGPPGTVVS